MNMSEHRIVNCSCNGILTVRESLCIISSKIESYIQIGERNDFIDRKYLRI